MRYTLHDAREPVFGVGLSWRKYTVHVSISILAVIFSQSIFHPTRPTILFAIFVALLNTLVSTAITIAAGTAKATDCLVDQADTMGKMKRRKISCVYVIVLCGCLCGLDFPTTWLGQYLSVSLSLPSGNRTGTSPSTIKSPMTMVRKGDFTPRQHMAVHFALSFLFLSECEFYRTYLRFAYLPSLRDKLLYMFCANVDPDFPCSRDVPWMLLEFPGRWARWLDGEGVWDTWRGIVFGKHMLARVVLGTVYLAVHACLASGVRYIVMYGSERAGFEFGLFYKNIFFTTETDDGEQSIGRVVLCLVLLRFVRQAAYLVFWTGVRGVEWLVRRYESKEAKKRRVKWLFEDAQKRLERILEQEEKDDDDDDDEMLGDEAELDVERLFLKEQACDEKRYLRKLYGVT